MNTVFMVKNWAGSCYVTRKIYISVFSIHMISNSKRYYSKMSILEIVIVPL